MSKAKFIIGLAVTTFITGAFLTAPVFADTVLYQQADYSTAVYSGWTGTNPSGLSQALGNQLSGTVTSINLKVSCPQGGNIVLLVYDSDTPYSSSSGMGNSTLLWGNTIACPGGQTTTPTDLSIPISLATTSSYFSPPDLTYDGLVLNPSKYYYLALSSAQPDNQPLYVYGSNNNNSWRTSSENAFVCYGWYCYSYTTDFYGGLKDIFFNLRTAPSQPWPVSNVKFGFSSDGYLKVSFDWNGPSGYTLMWAGFDGTISQVINPSFVPDSSKDMAINFEGVGNGNYTMPAGLPNGNYQAGQHYDVTVGQLHFWKPVNYIVANNCSIWGCDPLTRTQIESAMGRGFQPGDYITLSFSTAVNGIWYKFNDSNKYYFSQPPIISSGSLGQFKSDGLTPIPAGGTTTEDTVNFKATVTSPSSNQVSIEVQVLDSSNNIIKDVTSLSVSSGSAASVSASGLSDGQYHWRARAVDSQGNTSSWQAFGTTRNADFVVHTVPLYTQVVSPYPSVQATQSWATQQYANGNYGCRDRNTGISDIKACGCAIVSAVMVGRFYGLDSSHTINFSDPNPFQINAWLTANNGYPVNGLVDWNKVSAYFGTPDHKTYLKFTGFANYGSSIIDQFASLDQPFVIYKSVPGHFLVADGKLISTYTVKDPYWYNTRNLGQVKDIDNHIQAYNNVFDSARLYAYSPQPQPITAAIELVLGSPGELLIVDSQGRKLGKDPVYGYSYNEIPGGVYTTENISSQDPMDSNSISPDVGKIIYIPNASSGNYLLSVTGTGVGNYTLSSATYDQQGNSDIRTFVGNIQPDIRIDYSLSYDNQNTTISTIAPTDIVSPTTSFTVSGSKGLNSWFVSDVTVTLSAQDNPGGVGVFKTEYSSNNGTTWQTYTSSFTVSDEGIHTILYRSQDYVGNTEQTKSQEIKIDKTPPEAELYFDPTAKQLKVEGVDNLTVNSVVSVTTLGNNDGEDERSKKDQDHQEKDNKTVYQIQDEAGHTLRLTFQKLKQHGKEIKAGLENLQYDNQPIIKLSDTEMNYEWSLNKGQVIKELEQGIKVEGKFDVEAKYNSQKNRTEVRIKLGNQKETKQILPGLVIIKLTTKSRALYFEF